MYLIKIDKETFELMFREHLKTLGPNPGNGWFGKFGWHVKQKSKFAKQLKNEGYEW